MVWLCFSKELLCFKQLQIFYKVTCWCFLVIILSWNQNRVVFKPRSSRINVLWYIRLLMLVVNILDWCVGDKVLHEKIVLSFLTNRIRAYKCCVMLHQGTWMSSRFRSPWIQIRPNKKIPTSCHFTTCLLCIVRGFRKTSLLLVSKHLHRKC